LFIIVSYFEQFIKLITEPPDYSIIIAIVLYYLTVLFNSNKEQREAMNTKIEAKLESIDNKFIYTDKKIDDLKNNEIKELKTTLDLILEALTSYKPKQNGLQPGDTQDSNS
jgi:hypothetical protein